MASRTHRPRRGSASNPQATGRSRPKADISIGAGLIGAPGPLTVCCHWPERRSVPVTDEVEAMAKSRSLRLRLSLLAGAARREEILLNQVCPLVCGTCVTAHIIFSIQFRRIADELYD